MKLARTRSLLASAVLAAAAVGFLEATAMSLVGDPAGSSGRALSAWATSFSFASLGALPVTLALLLALGGVARLRLGRAIWDDLTASGPARARVIWRVLLAGAVAGVFALVVFKVAAATYAAYADRDPALFGAFIAAAATGLAAVLVFLAIAGDRQLGERVAMSRLAARAVSGWPMRAVVVTVVLGAIAVPYVLIRVGRPDVHPLVSIAACVLLVATVAVRTSRAGHRPRLQLLAVAAFVLMVGGLALVPGSDTGRARVVANGLVSKLAFGSITRRFADRDGDGYAARFFGGADCNDRKKGQHPRALDVPGNGVDENCTGADADAAWEQERFQPRRTIQPGAPKLNILLVSIDCMRADHTGAHGYQRPTTPTFDRLAASGTRFAWAFSPQPLTRQALASLLTGRYPSALLWNPNRMHIHWKETRATGISEVLNGAGYDTGMIACCDRFNRAEGELIGFKHRDLAPIAVQHDTPGWANGDVVAQAASSWLKKRAGASRPFFLWTHLIDAHAPYEVPAGGASFGDEDVDRYDSELAFADRNVAAMLAAIDELGLTEQTIVVVTADHGEEFMEHGIPFHARSLFNQVTHIPLVIHVPGAGARVVDTPVSLVDIMPTVLDLVGVDGPPGMNGASLAAAILGRGPAPERPLLMEVYPQKNVARDLIGAVHQGRKIVWDREANAFNLFSLTDDPDDAHDLAVSDPDGLETMKEVLFQAIDRELSSSSRAPKGKKRKKMETKGTRENQEQDEVP